MKYYSTRDIKREHPTSLREAAFNGLAPDGGLYIPEYIPIVDLDRVKELANESYASMATYLASLFLDNLIPYQTLKNWMEEVYNFNLPLAKVGDKEALELFHGPTCAFKDFGAGFMGKIMGHLCKEKQEITILTATSGDTGSAVARGFYKVDWVNVVVLFPKGKVSPLQKAQMTTLGENIHAIEVEGTFDDCQRMVKEVFTDSKFREELNVSSANSINLLRWLPQSFYYFYAYTQWEKNNKGVSPVVVVPSGNYGNLSAGMLAKKMGLPIKKFVAASNVNDIVPQYLLSGIYTPKASIKSVANAMDVGAPSNFERMMWLCNNSYNEMKLQMDGFSCTDSKILSTIKEVYDNFGYILDPHSAVGYAASKEQESGFYLSTAAPAKFREVIEPVIKEEVPLPTRLAELIDKESKSYNLKPNTADLKEYLKIFIHS